MTPSDVRSSLREGLEGLATDDGDLGETLEMAAELTELLRPYAAPGFECVMAALPPAPPVVYPGLDGIKRAWTDLSESFRSIRAEIERTAEGESSVVMLVSQAMVTRHGGVEMSQPGALVLVLDGEHVANVQFHLDHRAALRAGGLAAGPDA